MHNKKNFVSVFLLLIVCSKSFADDLNSDNLYSENLHAEDSDLENNKSDARIPDGWKYSFDIESFSLSEPIPVSGVIDDDWNHRFDGGENILTHNRLKVSAESRNWHVNLLQRFDYYADFNPDTAELVYRDKNRLPVDSERRYQADLTVNHLRASGMGLTYLWHWNKKFNTSLQITYWKPDLITDGHISGIIQTSEVESFEGDLWVDYDYTRDLLFARPKTRFSGKGYSIDWKFEWNYSEKLQLTFEARDVYNRFEWEKATFTRAKVTSNTTNFDDDGFINFSPTLSGIEGVHNHRQKLPAQYRLDLQYDYGDNEILTEVRQYNQLILARVGMRHQLTSALMFRWLLDPEYQSLTTGIESGGFYLEFTTDSLQLSDSHILALNLHWQF